MKFEDLNLPIKPVMDAMQEVNKCRDITNGLYPCEISMLDMGSLGLQVEKNMNFSNELKDAYFYSNRMSEEFGEANRLSNLLPPNELVSFSNQLKGLSLYPDRMSEAFGELSQIDAFSYSSQWKSLSLYSNGMNEGFGGVSRISNLLRPFVMEIFPVKDSFRELRSTFKNITMPVNAIQNHFNLVDVLLKNAVASMDGYQSRTFLNEMEERIEKENLKEEFREVFSSPNSLSTSELKNRCYRVAFSLIIILLGTSLTEKEIQDTIEFIFKAIGMVAGIANISALKTKPPEPVEIHHHHYHHHRKEEKVKRDSNT